MGARSGAARTGVITTPHGEIRTPAFIPVGTKATVKALLPETVRDLGAQAVLANAYASSGGTGTADPESGSILLASIGVLLLAGVGARAGQLLAYSGGALVRVAVEPDEEMRCTSRRAVKISSSVKRPKGSRLLRMVPVKRVGSIAVESASNVLKEG